MGYILEGISLVPRLSCMVTVCYILFACSVPPGDLVVECVRVENSMYVASMQVVDRDCDSGTSCHH